MITTLFSVTAEKIEVSNEVMNPAYIKAKCQNIIDNSEQPTFGPALFAQLPYEPWESWGFYTSDRALGYLCADDFWEVMDEICDIHWWGVSAYWSGSGWIACDPTDMIFEIIFYQDAGGVPGAPVQIYTNITPTMINTGNLFGTFPLYYFETDLSNCYYNQNGWISIQSIYSPNDCGFLWAGSPDGNYNAKQNDGAGWVSIDPEDNLAFILTGGGPDPEPLVCCDPITTTWVEVPPGDPNVAGKVYVWNCGATDSILYWYVDTSSLPAWMSTPVFSPPSGVIIGGGPGTNVEFTFTAPTGALQTFTGSLKIINYDDTTNFCDLPLKLETPRERGLFLNIFEHIMNQFPLLKTIFGF
jgi:hypothetical protein